MINFEKIINKEKKAELIRLKKFVSEQKVVKIQFGCGPRILKKWINIDLHYCHYQNYLKYYTDKYYPPEIRGDKNDFFTFDITKAKLPLKDNSVDLIFHEDFLEHLNQKQQIIFLAETYRVLKKNHVHRINTPNLLISMKQNSHFKKGIAGVFQNEWDKNHHLNVLTPKTLQELSELIGYSQIIFQKRNLSVSKLIPLEYRPDPKDRPENGNIFADLIK
ncbi:class I SAM-dependent methyltransferase [Candidatus Beckwithbacteria bacterium]|nr:class I SAM-dependent methyltransferase [Candidatus Beckwithbacteria bacterium]